MTTIIGKKTKEPEMCMHCGRRAYALCVGPIDKGPVAWVCDDYECIAGARRMLKIKPRDLDAYEIYALADAAREKSRAMLTLFMSAMWDAGATDLEKATPEQIQAAAESVCRNGELGQELRGVFAAFRDGVTKRVFGNEAPF